MKTGNIPLPDVTFSRKDPQTYVVLISRAGPEGVLLGTQHFKPVGTEYATALDLYEAGFVPDSLLVDALALLDEDLADKLMSRLVATAPEKDAAVARRMAEQLSCRSKYRRQNIGLHVKR